MPPISFERKSLFSCSGERKEGAVTIPRERAALFSTGRKEESEHSFYHGVKKKEKSREKMYLGGPVKSRRPFSKEKKENHPPLSRKKAPRLDHQRKKNTLLSFFPQTA